MAAPIHALVVGPVGERLGRRLARDHRIRRTDTPTTADCLLDAGPLRDRPVVEGAAVSPHVVLYESPETPPRALAAGADRCVHLTGDASADAATVAAVVRSALTGDPPSRRETLVRESVDALADVFFLFDTDMRFLAWNRRLITVTGYDASEVVTMEPTDFVADEDEAAIAAAIRRAVRTGRATEEGHLVTRDGEHVPYEFTGTALTDDRDDVVGVCGIGRDITERRRRERTLERRTDRLRTLNRINEVIRNVNGDLVRASTREEVVQSVCGRLADEEPYRFAWLGEYSPGRDRVTPVAHAGEGTAYLDARGDLEFDDGDRTAETAARTGEVVVAQHIADGDGTERWRPAALAADFASAAAIPLRYRGVTHGVLCVYADRPDAFDATERDVLAELGRTVAYAMSALDRRRALIADTVLELAFDLPDGSLFPVAAAREGATVDLVGTVPNGDGTSVQFYRVEGVAPEHVVAATDDTCLDAHVARTDRDGGVVRVTVGRTLADALVDHGGVVDDLHAEGDDARAVTVFPPGTDARSAVAAVEAWCPAATLAARRERTRDSLAADGLLAGLTDRQREVLRRAYLSGYFDSPRANTGADLADSLGISTATFHEHLRVAERKLVERVFADGSPEVG
ncbi:bacterio-opsin activator domain-containing protein [Halomarina ordinaria]|uniref:Bacterio-opsin activator domain-containing protein n=1 Tax=Halomarina ordinaria TaxID=3033939 RepID=A0ABD5UB15_9EURY|nr:bacterio-opsin activator domain-containing protein [Halomarina sp. PSRA2]